MDLVVLSIAKVL